VGLILGPTNNFVHSLRTGEWEREDESVVLREREREREREKNVRNCVIREGLTEC